jgi:hypothetical protein
VSGAFSACATEAAIERGEAAGRDDILAWVNPGAAAEASYGFGYLGRRASVSW